MVGQTDSAAVIFVAIKQHCGRSAHFVYITWKVRVHFNRLTWLRVPKWDNTLIVIEDRQKQYRILQDRDRVPSCFETDGAARGDKYEFFLTCY